MQGIDREISDYAAGIFLRHFPPQGGAHALHAQPGFLLRQQPEEAVGEEMNV